MDLATRWYAEAGKRDHAAAQCALGDFYSHGVGLCSKDFERAIGMMGHVDAQARHGFTLMHRYGVRWNYEEEFCGLRRLPKMPSVADKTAKPS
ncbi:hypothetical protein M427DRAFT_56388 [Gonapodya prolifera JEL478]|uniref:HCP-like protein n=1 Tax=Gonapodya prolifera (strain JEL478) TaxID=1344416 RepID=A0A139AGX8_GONPJ|nr:hypothetical protein M427DRAFT_56388 [Gonapodya prolifera JEL478]|eukprot:KXS15814.1 hypothetical protein M427DRAFT_56388 [Gonapodya prolifera JEL478]